MNTKRFITILMYYILILISPPHVSLLNSLLSIFISEAEL